MATTNSNHHSPKSLYLKTLVTNQRSNSTNNDEFDNFEMIKFDIWNTSNKDENTISKTMVTTSRKLLLKPHQTLPISGKSLPISIPNWSRIMRDHVDDDNGDDDDDWLPPHEYLSRIRSASLSVHEGVGRTLKGRDLRRLRNAIWKQTGFEQD